MASKENEGGRYSGKPFQLRPSVLGSSKTDLSSCSDSALQKESKSFVLRPSALTAIADKIDTREQRKRQPEEESEEEDENRTEEKRRKLSDSSNDVKLQLTEPLPKPTGIGSFGFGTEENVNGAPAGSSNGEKDQNEASSGFVFGQNISSRVTGFKDLPSESDSEGATGNKSDMVPESEKERLLMEAAHEHMHNLSKNKQQLQEVETFNGEEGERNVLMVQCKVHLFDSAKMIWLEKGRGTVKLNDMCQSERFGVFQSRIVFRTQGNHLVVFNAKLWPQMKCEKASEKSVRITAMDADTKEVKIFLISATAKDVHQLFTAIDRRIQALRRNQESLPSTVDESCDSNDNESRVADDEDSRSEDSPSSRSPSLDQTHPEEDPEQSFESCSERQENKKDQSGSENPDSCADEAGT